ncbi:MOSC domain-containing protein [Rubrobacter marinus]|uniref:MOSC domain-containing protein n=1 Tax=Rubrobacter marinus TaxID=2653852 RepID=A0A6G8PVB3_9ACTN|nr:MOSC domain-containing protein [Rubrobacter marinus]QIN78125.1 MOSC domain-containing protein [Rubrobacter marinus]
MSARVVSLNVGLPRPLAHGRGEVRSGIFKSPVRGALRFGEAGLEGDGQADTEHHGGADKAVCVYATEHLPYWQRRLGRSLEPGAFGENLSTEGLAETRVRIGDVYRVGTALAQVSQPRIPCFKLGARHGEGKLALWVKETGLTGFYLRCVEPGEVRAGDEILPVESAEHGFTVAEANRVMHGDGRDVAGMERLLATPALSAEWKRMLEVRLRKATAGQEDKLTGRSAQSR